VTMERPTQPGDIAREAIRRLASRRQPPIPENFSRAYAEVEGREAAAANWPNTLRALIRQWDSYQTGLSSHRARIVRASSSAPTPRSSVPRPADETGSNAAEPEPVGAGNYCRHDLPFAGAGTGKTAPFPRAAVWFGRP